MGEHSVVAAPRFSIAVVSFNAREYLDRCLASVFREARTVPSEVLVVDNRSADGSPELVRSRYPGAVLIEPGENLGYGRAADRAFRRARGARFLLLNSDVELGEGCLAALDRFFEARPRAGIVGCRLLETDGSLQRSCRSFPTLSGLVSEATGLYRLFPKHRGIGRYYLTAMNYDEEAEVDVPLGALLAVRRETYEEVAGMDPRFFMYAEETDLCYRARLRGWEIRYTPSATATHHGGVSTATLSEDMYVEIHRSLVLFMKIHHGPSSAAAARLILAAGTVFRAAFWGLAWISTGWISGERSARLARRAAPFGAALAWHFGFRRALGDARESTSVPAIADTTVEAGDVREGEGTSLPAPPISVVIPVRDSRDDLVRCLESLERQTVPRSEFEVVVVDDGSRDLPPADLERFGVRLVRQERLGAAPARNRGVRESRGDIVVFLDADCVAEESWLERLSAPLREDASLTGTVGRCGSDQKSVVARFIQLEYDSRYGRLGSRKETDFVNTANSAFRREVLLRYPLREDFRRLEDVELSFRLNVGRHRMVYAGDARVRHRHPTAVVRLLRRKFDYARYAWGLYRLYPKKAASDSSTPQARRAHLLLLALGLATTPLALVRPDWAMLPVLLVLASTAFAARLFVKAFRESILLGLAAPGLVLLCGLSFVAGSLWGALGGGKTGRAADRAGPDSVPGNGEDPVK